MRPYTEFPVLLGLLLRLLNSDISEPTRREVLKVLGIMGALDPHIHKQNQQSLQGSHGEGYRIGGAESGPHNARSLEEVPSEFLSSGGFLTANEEFFPTVHVFFYLKFCEWCQGVNLASLLAHLTSLSHLMLPIQFIYEDLLTSFFPFFQVAIKALMRVLKDPSLSSYHHRVVGSLMYILEVRLSSLIMLHHHRSYFGSTFFLPFVSSCPFPAELLNSGSVVLYSC